MTYLFSFKSQGLEKYVMTKLFSRVFASFSEDVKCDEQLSEKMALIQQFIRPENLDIKPTFQNETSWLVSGGILLSCMFLRDASCPSQSNVSSIKVLRVKWGVLFWEDDWSGVQNCVILSSFGKMIGVESETVSYLTVDLQLGSFQVPSGVLLVERRNELAQKELQKINMYKAPRDKLVCILSCCKVINNLLLNASIASNENPPGADEFLPVLIYVTIKANPPQLHSNLMYIQRYRHQSRLVSEAAYFFTNMLSSQSFILNIDAKSLSMDETEFENNMESARALISSLSTGFEGLSDQGSQDVGYAARTEPTNPKLQALNSKERDNYLLATQHYLPPQSTEKNSVNEEEDVKDHSFITEKPSISDMENKGANELLKEDQVSRAFQEYPYLYAHVGDLTIDNVEDLLNRYKQLVFKYASLTKGLALATPSLPLPNLRTQPQTHTETCKESEDTRVIEMNNEKYEGTGRPDDGLHGVSLLEVENSESKLPQDESVTHQGGENDKISQ
ncbi:hypothetical protein HHK36_009076 [Tetracentron sinense]|uniref:VPS9 domain-containing protein n=1 Tax=Tetracentron sinense TaxID=13715 RepID=A0A835DH54_TETSI|nr:hypothetical protein HHK36_009076 [Tetracentron sinense]